MRKFAFEILKDDKIVHILHVLFREIRFFLKQGLEIDALCLFISFFFLIIQNFFYSFSKLSFIFHLFSSLSLAE